MWCSMQIISVFCALVALGHCITRNDCPSGLHRDHYLQVHGDFCYYFMTFKSQDFDHAKRDCASQGGHLVYVKDKSTQEYLYNLLRTVYGVTDPVWIGFTDDDSEAVWEWLDGSKSSYLNWASGQPGLGSTLEDCAAIEMDDGGKWHDFRCNDFLFIDFGHPYVCQYGPFTTKTTVATTTAEPTILPVTARPTTTTPVERMTTTTTTTTTFPTTSTTTPASETTSTSTPPSTMTMTTTSTTTLPSTITLLLQSTTTTQPRTTTTTPVTMTMTSTTPLPTTTTTPSTTTTTPFMTKTTTVPPTTTSTVPPTTTTPPMITKCPPANCPNLDCGLDGYKRGANGCKMCECDV